MAEEPPFMCEAHDFEQELAFGFGYSGTSRAIQRLIAKSGTLRN